MTPLFLNTHDVYLWTTIILAVGLSIKTLELWRESSEFNPGGSFDWQIVGRDSMLVSQFQGVLRSIYSRNGMLIIFSTSLLSFFGLVVFGPFVPHWGLFRIFFILLAVSNLFVYYRQGFGLDGADQMSMVILLTTLFCFIPTDSQTIHLIGIFFITAQLFLSYLVSGIAKLISTEWRSGLAIQGILSTYTYGTSITRDIFTNRKKLSQVVCWMVIVLEIIYPAAIFLDIPYIYGAVIAGILFHVSIAVLMGLNDFVWGFSSAYPSLIFATYLI